MMGCNCIDYTRIFTKFFSDFCADLCVILIAICNNALPNVVKQCTPLCYFAV